MENNTTLPKKIYNLMKDLQPYPTDLDKYLFSLLELLRTKYNDVSCNRGSKSVYFYLSEKGKNTHLLQYMCFECPNEIILEGFVNSEIPKEIKMLIE